MLDPFTIALCVLSPAATLAFAITARSQREVEVWMLITVLEALAFWLLIEITENPQLTRVHSQEYQPLARVCAFGCGTPEILTSNPTEVGASGSVNSGRAACCAVSAILRRPGHQSGRASHV